MAFKAVTEDLQTPDDYELITYRMMERLKAENVLHAEVYVSVGVCLWRKQDFDAIFEGLDRGRRKGERDFGVSLLWIFDAVRQFGPAPPAKSSERLRVIGIATSWLSASAATSRRGRPSYSARPMRTPPTMVCVLPPTPEKMPGLNRSGARSIFARSGSGTA